MKASAVTSSVLLCLLLAACNGVPKQGPALVHHDLGMVFPAGAAHNPVPLRSISVVAHPIVNSVAIQYRDAAAPTRRNAWASNRWAAAPAAMSESALGRLLAHDGAAGRCRLVVALNEFIVDIDASGKGQAVLAADLRLSGDAGQVQQTAFDLRSPLARVEPAAAAAAFRTALQQLGERSAAWLGGPAGQACRS